MRPTGKRSNTSGRTSRHGHGRREAQAVVPAVVAAAALAATVLLAAAPAVALDVFTLWRQPEVPLRLEAGAWVR